MLHFDVLRRISLELDPRTLAVNKQSFLMYDDNWYHDFYHIGVRPSF